METFTLIAQGAKNAEVSISRQSDTGDVEATRSGVAVAEPSRVHGMISGAFPAYPLSAV